MDFSFDFNGSISIHPDTPLFNRASLADFFMENAVFMEDCEMIPEYLLVETFGDKVSYWLNAMEDSATEWSTYGYAHKPPHGDYSIRFVKYAGFKRIISLINLTLEETRHYLSDAKFEIDTARELQQKLHEQTRTKRTGRRLNAKEGKAART